MWRKEEGLVLNTWFYISFLNSLMIVDRVQVTVQRCKSFAEMSHVPIIPKFCLRKQLLNFPLVYLLGLLLRSAVMVDLRATG